MQIVKSFGLKAYAISRTLAKKEKLLNVGYDDVLSLTDPKLEENIMDLTNGIGFDLAYDCVGGEYFINLVNTVKARGLIVNYGNLNKRIVFTENDHRHVNFLMKLKYLLLQQL